MNEFGGLQGDHFGDYVDGILSFFNQNDDNSDVDMYDFFVNNYKQLHLFHDPYHPTNTFFYEIFRQLVKILLDINLTVNDTEFINTLSDIEMTYGSLPVLPYIKECLQLNIPEKIPVFYPNVSEQRLYLSIYDYYFIRLSKKNFKTFLQKQ